MSITEIRDQVLRLDDEDRAELIGSILESLAGADPNDRNQDSLAEAKVRGEELASGVVAGIPKKQFLDEIRNSRAS